MTERMRSGLALLCIAAVGLILGVASAGAEAGTGTATFSAIALLSGYVLAIIGLGYIASSLLKRRN